MEKEDLIEENAINVADDKILSKKSKFSNHFY